MSREPIAVRMYGSLVRLYPRQFRDDYSADMVQLVRDQCVDEPAWKVCGRAAIDLAITLPAQQMEAHMNRTPNLLVPLFYTAVATGGVLAAIVGGTNIAMVIVGACVAVAAGSMATIAWRRAGPLRGTTPNSGWWKFVVAGPAIIAAVIIAAGLGVEAWYLGMVSVFVAFLLTGIGLLLGLARLVHRSPPLPT
ncbi:MAG: hypothetical protein ABIQ73_26545 [Acidimicrobiales bacterium]